MLRFEKIKRSEANAVLKYQAILDRCRMTFSEDDEIVRLLSRLIMEERTHEKLAEELVRICRHTHLEYESYLD